MTEKIELEAIVMKQAEKLLDDKVGLKIHRIIESMLSDFKYRDRMTKKIRAAVDEIVMDDIEHGVKSAVRKYLRPKIIYVYENRSVPASIESLPVNEIFLAPSGPCIYFLCKNDEVVYIGKSINLSSRLGTHITLKDFDRVFYMNVPAMYLDLQEVEMIDLYQPKLNKTLR